MEKLNFSLGATPKKLKNMKQTLYKIIPMSANEGNEGYESHKQDRIDTGLDLYQLPHSKQIFRVIRAHFSTKTIIYRVEK